MLLNLNQRFVSMEGRVVKDIIKNENVPDTIRDLTLLRVITLALMEPSAKFSDDDKIVHFELCLKVVANKVGTVELTVEEVALIKALVKPKYGILIVGEAMRMLEGKVVGIDVVEEKKPESPTETEESIPDLPSPNRHQ